MPKKVEAVSVDGGVTVRHRFSPRGGFGFDFSSGGMTKQSFKDECDINVIMKRYEATGVIPFPERAAQGQYLDVSQVDFVDAMRLVADAKSAFQNLPSRIRDRFGNDPAALLSALEDPRMHEELRELGVLNAVKGEATPLAVRIVESPAGDSGETSKAFELEPSPPTGKVPPELIRKTPK